MPSRAFDDSFPLFCPRDNAPQLISNGVLWQPIAPPAAKLSPQIISHLPLSSTSRTPHPNNYPFTPKSAPGALTPSHPRVSPIAYRTIAPSHHRTITLSHHRTITLSHNCSDAVHPHYPHYRTTALSRHYSHTIKTSGSSITPSVPIVSTCARQSAHIR